MHGGSGRTTASDPGVGALLGSDPSIQRVRELIEQVAPTGVAVLLAGEPGTGKQLAAAAIHAASPRAEQRFLRLHCGSLDESAIEAELFGSEVAAGPGGAAPREGRLEQADGGTLLLGEVSDLPLPTQAKLLRFLEGRGFERLGGGETRRTDVRILAATERDLGEEVAAGRFREDLFYRLAIVRIDLPALRERRSDLEPIAASLLARLAEAHGRTIDGFAPEALERLLAHPWPGNVRELEAALERAVVMTRDRWIRPEHLEPALSGRPAAVVTPRIPGSTLAEIERVAILRTLEAVGGSTSRAAAMLGISTRKIQYRIREYREVGLLAEGPRVKVASPMKRASPPNLVRAS